ncbi:class F sortase [Geodermatophilus sp. DSM 44513]|uniref:class F sortase n=1 Tax=Geodermatophilus sp. DSM 44513 TaxID=1528104 RepID=UPI001274B20C|nr:class F sortase [Geodermatophilus sp. DSM 44513]WNV77684.1 class F sortase [Geodermatophilus sp. DSM 44513]
MPGDEQHGTVRPSVAGLAVLLVLAGVALVLSGVGAGGGAPRPPVVAATAPHAPLTAVARGGAAPAQPVPPLPAAVPVRLEIPAIGVTSDLLQLGLHPDGTVEVPPLDADAPAGWYRHSPTPGEVGPAVVLGHVDSAEHGPGVFFGLGTLVPGDTVEVTRSDGTAAVFTVERVESHPKTSFPTADVYGDTAHAALRLVTCGGAFDDRSRSYLDNVVVHASLTDTRPA